MITELTKAHWMDSKEANQGLILECKMKSEMAKAMIELCEKKIAEFPVEELKKEEIPDGVN